MSFSSWEEFTDNRARKGFNVIQAVAVAELDGLKPPTYEGGLVPFKNLDTLEVNDAYFDHLCRVIKYANEKGIFISLVPMWGSYLVPNLSWGGKVKPLFDAAKAAAFVTYLAQRVKDLDVIWLLGGDRSYIAPEHKAIIRAMAEAVRSVGGNRQLITAHTQGGRSLWDMLEEPSYLDFLTWQSGHMGRYYPSWRNIEADYARTPLPVLDAEPCYESLPVMNEYTFSRSDSASRFTEREVRRTSYWTVFSGAAGITYGCDAIWQMHREEDENVEIPESAASAYRNDTIPFWHRSLNFPGAFQIPVLRRFMENLPHAETVKPDNSLILSDNPKGEGHCCALTNEERDFVAVYVPSHEPVTVDVSAFGYDGFVIYWFDPRYEIYNRLSDDNSETKFLTMPPPASGEDFVLLLVRKGVPFNAR